MVETINNQIETPEADAWQNAVDVINKVPAWDPALEKLINETFPTPESRSEENMENIYTFALENGISPYMILAYGYKEDAASNTIQATETDLSMEAPDAFNIVGKWRAYQTYEQVGNIENNVMTWAVLDFTWSMKKVQIESMINTFLALNEKWIITPQTKISVMYDIADQDNEGENSDITVDKLKDTDAKTQSISFGEGWEGLKNYLQSKGLVDNNRKVLEAWLGSTPLYSTILNNLMNSTVRESTVFTDGASDRSKNQAIWPEELWNTEARDAMIYLCKNFDKRITIVAFNMKDEYMTRTEAMEKHFKDNGASEYLDILNLWEVKDDELAKKLTEKMTSKYSKVEIKEDPDMVNGRSLKIDPEWSPVGEKNKKLNLPAITDENVQVVYDEANDTYKVDLAAMFPGVDLSQYDIKYKINSYNQVEQDEIFTESQFKSNTYVLDISHSMNVIPKTSMRKEWFYTNPNVSFEELLRMQQSIRGFKYEDNKFYIGGFAPWDGLKVPAMDFNKPDAKLSGLILKSRIQRYEGLVKTDPENQATYNKEIENIKLMLKNMNTTWVATNEVITICVDEVKNMKEETKGQITNIYGHLYTLENIGTDNRTPVIDAFSLFAQPEFCKGYKDQTVNFLTDFWDNESTGELNKLFKKIDNKIGVGDNEGFGWLYNTNKGIQKTGKGVKLSDANAKVTERDNMINENFENSDFVQKLQETLVANNTKVNFIYPKTYTKSYYRFLTALWDHINKKTGKEMITLQKLDSDESLFVPRNYEAVQHPYTRASLSVTLTNKQNPTDVRTSTVKVRG